MTDYWIQKSDFSSDEVKNSARRDIHDAFDKFDWNAELKEFDKIEENGCPPGFGVIQNGKILHICPKDLKEVYFFYHYTKRSKFLGLISHKSEEVHMVTYYEFKNVHKLIDIFLDGKENEILDISI